MKKYLITFACIEAALLSALALFLLTNQYAAWLYPLLLTLIGASFVVGIALLFSKKR